MAAKRNKKMDDEVFKYLLNDYERNGLSPEEKEELISTLNAASTADEGTMHTPVFVPRIVLAAAAAVVLFFGGGLYLNRAPLANPVTVASTGREEIVGKAGMIEAPDDFELQLRSKTEFVILSPGTELTVKGAPLRRLSGETENTYGLTAGDVYIEHSNGSFRLETDYGSFSPAGTIISCTATQERVVLYCLEGRMQINPRQGRAFFLEAGTVLTALKGKDGWSREVTGIPARIEYFRPESRREAKKDRDAEVQTEAEVEADVESESVVETDVQAEPEVETEAEAKTETGTGAEAELEAEAVVERVPETAEKPVVEKAESSRWDKIWASSSSGYVSASAAEGRLYVYNGNALSTYDYSTGELVGNTGLEENYKSTGLEDGGFFGYTGNGLEALKASDGVILWRIDSAPVVYSGFTVKDGKLYLPSVDGTLYIYGADDGNSLMRITIGSGLYGRTAVSGNRAVFSSIDKKITCVDIDSGALLWQSETAERLMGDLPVFSANSKTVLYWDETGRIVLLDAFAGTPLGEASFEPPMVFAPEASGANFVYRDNEGLRILSAETLTTFEPSELDEISKTDLKDAELFACESRNRILTDAGLYSLERREFIPLETDIANGFFLNDTVFIITVGGQIERWEYR